MVVDTVRVRWDPDVRRSIDRAGSRIASSLVRDWTPPLRADVLLARGYTGDGSIDFPPFATAVDAAEDRGDIEVEMVTWDTAATLAGQPGLVRPLREDTSWLRSPTTTRLCSTPEPNGPR